MKGSPSGINYYQGDTSILESTQTSLDSTRMPEDEDDRGQRLGIGATESSSPIASPDVVRPRPLILSSGSSSFSTPQPRRTCQPPSSPEDSTQKLSLQAHSPASLIFERNVQEDILLPQTSPSIPLHIRTEDHIPPVLEASSAAITNSRLDPDSVEIVTHSMHQPAHSCVVHGQPISPSPSSEDAGPDTADSQDSPFTGRALDTSDIRRLSFISFADVVNAEHAETSEPQPSRELGQGTVSSANAYQNRSPSPLHSPASSHAFGTSPPTSISTSFKGPDLSPNRGGPGAESPLFAAQWPLSPNFIGELNIETMRQALKRTGSGDLSASRSQVSSTTGNDD